MPMVKVPEKGMPIRSPVKTGDYPKVKVKR